MRKTNIICLMGKSGTGKTTIFNDIVKTLDLNPVVLDTTRPIRTGEEDGKDYNFVNDFTFNIKKVLDNYMAVAEYNTVHGVWKYGIPKDYDISKNYIVITTPAQYSEMVENKSSNVRLHPVYIKVNEDERISRLTERENNSGHPDFDEMKRRIETDKRDFSEEVLNNIDNLKFLENNGDIKASVCDLTKMISKMI